VQAKAWPAAGLHDKRIAGLRGAAPRVRESAARLCGGARAASGQTRSPRAIIVRIRLL
jgi:hypothetical protein